MNIIKLGNLNFINYYLVLWFYELLFLFILAIIRNWIIDFCVSNLILIHADSDLFYISMRIL